MIIFLDLVTLGLMITLETVIAVDNPAWAAGTPSNVSCLSFLPIFAITMIRSKYYKGNLTIILS